jgi:hypothetical protein
MVDPFADGQITHLLSLLSGGRKRPFAVEMLAAILNADPQQMVQRHPHADSGEVHVGMLDHFVRVGKAWGNPKCLDVSSAVSWRLVQTAVISKSGSTLKAGMWASRPQQLRTFAPMMPTRIFFVAISSSSAVDVTRRSSFQRVSLIYLVMDTHLQHTRRNGDDYMGNLEV